MNDDEAREMMHVTRRDFLKWMGIGSGAAAIAAGSLHYFRPADAGDNPLARSINREWEKIYRDQYKYDGAFDWVCSPNDTHACRVRAYVRNGIVTRMGSTYDYQNYADLYGNKATVNWNPRQCAKGYTFHRVIYGPYRLRHPIVRKGWKDWADAGFPELTPENKSRYMFDARGQDEFVQISWPDAFDAIAKALVAISTRYSGEAGKKLLLAQGYQPEMVDEMGGAGTRTIKMRGGMGLLGVIGKYGMYRLNNSLALLDDCDAFALCDVLADELSRDCALECAACCCACMLWASVCENGATAGVFAAGPVLPEAGLAAPESAPRRESDDMAMPLVCMSSSSGGSVVGP